MRIRKRNSGALPIGMPDIQRIKENAEKGDRDGENESGDITRRYKVNKTYAGVH